MLFTQKTKVLLAHVHSLLTIAEEQADDGKGRPIVAEENEEVLRDAGNAIVAFAEKNGCTRSVLSNTRNRTLFASSKFYYQLVMDTYAKYVDYEEDVINDEEDVDMNGNTHIPILYALFMVSQLKARGLIGLELDYMGLDAVIQNSELLKGEKKESRFGKQKFVYDKKK